MDVVMDERVKSMSIRDLEGLRLRIDMQFLLKRIDRDTYARADIQIINLILKKKEVK